MFIINYNRHMYKVHSLIRMAYYGLDDWGSILGTAYDFLLLNQVQPSNPMCTADPCLELTATGA
jgi:hypothetical protein